jgi:predicted MFS family arabinose efflux permease
VVRAFGRAFGPPPIDRLVRTSAFSSAADAFVAVSLAGSLFFNVSIDAARPRIVLYLVMTMAPFAVVAPLIGPFVDRVRGGHRWVIAVACAARAALCLGLAFNLRAIWLYPLAFSILVMNKTHQVAKSALVPRLVDHREQLVAANSTHARVVAVAGALGGGVAAGVLNLASASVVLFVGSALYAVAVVVAMRIPRPAPVVTTPTMRVIEQQELRNPSLVLAVGSMALLRGVVGYFTFFAAFTMKASGEPAWVFGLVAVAAGLGGFGATFLAPGLRRLLLEERILEVALVSPALVAVVAPKGFVAASLVVTSLALGLAANLGRQGFDSLVQRDAPDAERGRAFARFEARLQLTWVAGALVPVVVRPNSTVGLYAMAGLLLVGAVFYGTTARAAVKRHWGQWSGVLPATGEFTDDVVVPLPAQLVRTATMLAERGARRQAVMVCAAALDAARRADPRDRADLTDALLEIEGLAERAARPREELTEADATRAIEVCRSVLSLTHEPDGTA